MAGLKYDVLLKMHRLAFGMTSKTIAVGAHVVSYYEGGTGETLLLLHGMSANKHMWMPLLPALMRKYRVIGVDLPGFGDSSRIEGDVYTIAAQSVRLKKIVDALGLRGFHIAGSSMGGAIAVKYAADYPDNIKSLALFATAGVYSTAPSMYLQLLLQGRNALIIKKKEDMNFLMDMLFKNPPWIAKVLNIPMIIGSQALKDGAFHEEIMKQIFEEQLSIEDDLERIKVKTFILWGKEDLIMDPSIVPVLSRRLADSQVVILDNCGHLPMIERPGETARLYSDFLQAVNASKPAA